jgi:two-component system sensor histidine kinase KdpD
VVDSLLQMTRLESEILKPNLDWCDLHDVIAAARQAAGDGLSAHPVTVSLPDNLPLIKLDHSLFAQALANILHNAVIYTPKDTPIETTASLHGSKLRLIIRDHGPGLPSGEERRVFEKFYRAKGSPAGGTGLGLAIARGFVQAMGGDITARNHPDGGAEFVIEVERTSEFVPNDTPSPTNLEVRFTP